MRLPSSFFSCHFFFFEAWTSWGFSHLWCLKPVPKMPCTPEHFLLGPCLSIMTETRIWIPTDFGHWSIFLLWHVRKSFPVWWPSSCFSTFLCVLTIPLYLHFPISSRSPLEFTKDNLILLFVFLIVTLCSTMLFLDTCICFVIIKLEQLIHPLHQMFIIFLWLNICYVLFTTLKYRINFI